MDRPIHHAASYAPSYVQPIAESRRGALATISIRLR